MTQPIVLITGAAGFIGIHLCRFLLERGYAVRSLDNAPFEHVERAAVDVLQGVDALHGAGPQAESKIEAERLCEGARLSGTSVSILRLTGVTGSGRGGVLEKLFEHATAGRGFLTLGSGKAPCQLLDIEDLCEAIDLCLVMRSDLVNDTFNQYDREATRATPDRRDGRSRPEGGRRTGATVPGLSR